MRTALRLAGSQRFVHSVEYEYEDQYEYEQEREPLPEDGCVRRETKSGTVDAFTSSLNLEEVRAS
jgi:hypothetical protein